MLSSLVPEKCLLYYRKYIIFFGKVKNFELIQNIKSLKKINISRKEQEKLVERYEKFISGINFMISPTFEGNYNRRLSKNKIISVFIIRFIAFLTAIRFLLYPLFRTTYIRDLTCNATHYIANPFLLSINIVLCIIVCNILMGTSMNYWEVRGQNAIFNEIHKIKYRLTGYDLKRTVYSRVLQTFMAIYPWYISFYS